MTDTKDRSGKSRLKRLMSHCLGFRRIGGLKSGRELTLALAKSDDYGAVFAQYEGTGTLGDRHSTETQGVFRAIQLRDGGIIVLCRAPDAGLSWLLSSGRAMGLSGTTIDNSLVTANGLYRTTYLPALAHDEVGVYSAYRAQSLDVAVGSSEKSTMSRFAITNLTLANGDLRVSHPLTTEARIRAANGYAETVKRLRAVKGVDVTAHLEVQADERRIREGAANDICYLLSVARGTKVQWIAREDYSEDGAPVQFHHVPRVTKVYCPLPIIDPRDPKDTEAFLEVALPSYLAKRNEWDQMPGLIDTYLDAKAEADYLEVRGVKLAVAIEVLKEAFISATGRLTLACPRKFDEVRPKLKTAIRDVLREHKWEERAREIVYGNLGALNRVPFRDHLAALCKHIDLKLSDHDLKLFVKCRNSLVHHGRFYCETATEEDRRALAPHATSLREYFWLLHVLDRLLLRIVGYRGPYIDWSDVHSPRRVDSI